MKNFLKNILIIVFILTIISVGIIYYYLGDDKYYNTIFTITITFLFAWVIVFTSVYVSEEQRKFEIRQKNYDIFMENLEKISTWMSFVWMFLDESGDTKQFKKDYLTDVDRIQTNISSAAVAYFYELHGLIVSTKIYFFNYYIGEDVADKKLKNSQTETIEEITPNHIKAGLSILKEFLIYRKEIEQQKLQGNKITKKAFLQGAENIINTKKARYDILKDQSDDYIKNYGNHGRKFFEHFKEYSDHIDFYKSRSSRACKCICNFMCKNVE